MAAAEVGAEMPRYKSIKVVWALEVKTIEADMPPQKEGEDWAGIADWYKVTPADSGYAPVRLKGEVFQRYMPVPGDFIVQYADGYWSVSPRKAFVEGYIRER